MVCKWWSHQAITSAHSHCNASRHLCAASFNGSHCSSCWMAITLATLVCSLSLSLSLSLALSHIHIYNIYSLHSLTLFLLYFVARYSLSHTVLMSLTDGTFLSISRQFSCFGTLSLCPFGPSLINQSFGHQLASSISIS